jgi:ATP phosphoribosyltransferase
VAEKKVNPIELLKLNYGFSKLCFAAVEGSFEKLFIPPEEWKGLKDVRIATSFPNIVDTFLRERGLTRFEELIELEGAVEISVKLGIADAVVDIVETGTTLKQAGLKIMGKPFFESYAALYAHPGLENRADVLTLKNRLEGKLLAMEYMMVEYDSPEAILKKACAITPGIESPTVTSLQKVGWFSVKSMIKKRESQKIMDELSKLGCKGILLSSIDSARI